MKKFIIILILLLPTSMTFAFPKEVILVRHGDKFLERKTGPALTPKGVLRSIMFAHYFINKFGAPDYIIAARPLRDVGKASSIRELQSMGPLANVLAEKYPNSDFPIMHPYGTPEYKSLANDLLTQGKFNGKKILVCWSHTKIAKLAQELGAKKIKDKWSNEDFDSVYVLKFDSSGKVSDVTILHNQYPVAFNGNWDELYEKIKAVK